MVEIDPAYRDVYEFGYSEGLSGKSINDNPYRDASYEDRNLCFYWGEGFFDGYKVYLKGVIAE